MMHRLAVGVLWILTAALASCGTSAPRLADHSFLPRMPVVPGEFAAYGGEFETAKPQLRLAANDRRCESDQEAVMVAWQWLQKHFGVVGGNTAIEVEEVLPSATGDVVAASEEDVGHTVVFRQHLLGLPTDRFATVFVRGRLCVSGMVGIGDFAAIEAGGYPISRARAGEVLAVLIASRGIRADLLGSELLLEYRWVGRRESGEGLYRPVWAVRGGLGPCIDARSGEPIEVR